MEAIVRQIYTQWKIAKEQAQRDFESRDRHDIAEKYRQCDMFKGTERTVEELAGLLMSHEGMKFCIEYHFPSLNTFRLFKGQGVERLGVYIDAGTITLRNPEKAVLVGRTSATVFCDTLERHEIMLLHGAKAVVDASKWAVVFIKAQRGCSFIKNCSDKALIL